MKTTINLLAILALLLLPNHADSINYRNRQFVLISFNVSINSIVKEELDVLSPHFPPQSGRNVDPIIANLKGRSWAKISRELEQQVGMYLLPINAYSEFRYDEYGFPRESINRAIRKGTSRFYLRAELEIEPKEASTSFFGRQKSSDPVDSSPKITITITTYSNNGVAPIDRFKATAVAPEGFEYTAESLNGLVNPDSSSSPMTLYGLISQAINSIALEIDPNAEL